MASEKKKPRARAPREAKIQRAKQRVAPLVPDIDPGDLDLIIRSLLRPFGRGRRFFLRQIRPGVYVY